MAVSMAIEMTPGQAAKLHAVAVFRVEEYRRVGYVQCGRDHVSPAAVRDVIARAASEEGVENLDGCQHTMWDQRSRRRN